MSRKTTYYLCDALSKLGAGILTGSFVATSYYFYLDTIKETPKLYYTLFFIGLLTLILGELGLYKWDKENLK